MKIKFVVTPQKQVVHPPSVTVKSALHQMGHSDVTTLTLGRFVELEVTDSSWPSATSDELRKLAIKANIFNPVIEDCRVEVGG